MFSFPTRWVLLAVCSAMVTFISFLGAVKLNGCGEAHNNNLDCDILVAETEEFPKDAFTISLWVKASAPHEGRKYEEGEALFSFNTAKTVASTKSLTTSQIAVWQYYDEYLIFIISDGDKFGSIVKQMRTDNSTEGCKNWCHFAFTWKKTATLTTSTLKMYKNGELMTGTFSLSNASPRNAWFDDLESKGSLMIGNRGKDGSEAFEGGDHVETMGKSKVGRCITYALNHSSVSYVRLR